MDHEVYMRINDMASMLVKQTIINRLTALIRVVDEMPDLVPNEKNSDQHRHAVATVLGIMSVEAGVHHLKDSLIH